MGFISDKILTSWGVEIIKPEPTEKEKEFKEKLKLYNEKLKKEPPTPELKILNLEERKKQFDFVSQKLTGGFEINDQNKELINTLFFYFSKDKKFNNSTIVENENSLNKGILLIGNCGSGKTTILDIFRLVKWQGFRKFSTYNVVEDFETDGEKGIKTYFRGNIFFDDLGAEEMAYYYGKRENVGTRLLEKRYNSFLSDGLKTYATTNLTLDELIKKYGFRIEGRLYEMFNIIYVGKSNDSIDFRTKNHK